MGYFATFSQTDDTGRTAVRVADDGRTTLLVTGHAGEIISSVDGQIDPIEAADIVADMMLVAPELRHTGGALSFGIGEGEAAPQLVSLSRSQLPPSAFNIERRMLDVIQVTRQRPAREPATEREPGRVVGLTPGSFALWTGAFFIAHIVAEVFGWVLLGLAAKLMGLVGLLLSLPVFVAFVAGSYWVVGREFGKQYGRHDDAWKPAMAAVVVPSLISVLLGGGFARIGIAWIYPLVARWAAKRQQ